MALGALGLLAGCAGGTRPSVTQLYEPEPIRTSAEDAAGTDACLRRDATPAVIETVTERVLVVPPSVSVDGTQLYPAVYRTATEQRVIQEREELQFETLCDGEMTPAFIASLQRALKVRGYYTGPVTGLMTPQTGAAVRAFQQPQGLDSAVLSIAAARQLGLSKVARIGE